MMGDFFIRIGLMWLSAAIVIGGGYWVYLQFYP